MFNLARGVAMLAASVLAGALLDWFGPGAIPARGHSRRGGARWSLAAARTLRDCAEKSNSGDAFSGGTTPRRLTDEPPCTPARHHPRGMPASVEVLASRHRKVMRLVVGAADQKPNEA